MGNKTKQLMSAFAKAAVADQKAALDKVKVVNCVKAEIGGFTCEFEGPMGRLTGRFKKESEGWVFAGPGG